MTLTEFLLARLAEDEQRAYLDLTETPRARVLADVESKRTLVMSFDAHLDEGDGFAAAANMALAALALPFAAHPDYQEAWKP